MLYESVLFCFCLFFSAVYLFLFSTVFGFIYLLIYSLDYMYSLGEKHNLFLKKNIYEVDDVSLEFSPHADEKRCHDTQSSWTL